MYLLTRGRRAGKTSEDARKRVLHIFPTDFDDLKELCKINTSKMMNTMCFFLRLFTLQEGAGSGELKRPGGMRRGGGGLSLEASAL